MASGDKLDRWSGPAVVEADVGGGHWAAGRIREGIERSLSALGVRFDVWTSEASLHDSQLA